MNRFKNFLSLAGGESVSKLLTFAAFAYLARVLGPDGFGLVEFAGSVMLCAGLIVDQGFGPYGAREIARAPQRTVELVSEIVSARIILAIVAYIGVALFALALRRSPVLTQLVFIYGASLFVMPLLLQWVFQGHEQMRTVAVSQVIRQVLFAATVFACVRDASRIWIAGVAEVAGACGAAGYCLAMYRRRFGGAIRLRLFFSRRLVREGVPIGLSQMFWMIRMFGATLVLGIIAPAEDVGFFASGQRILIALHAFVWLYYFNLLPSFARAWQQQGSVLREQLRRSLHGVAWVSAATGVAWVLIAPAVTTAAYGKAFAPAGSVLQWLAGVCVVAALSGHYRFGLIAAGQQTAEMVTSVIGAVTALVLIPVLYRRAGPAGVAMALLAAETAVWLTAWGFARATLEVRDHGALLVRPALAGALALGVVRVLPWSSDVLRAALAFLTVAALAVAVDGGDEWSVRSWAHLPRKLMP
jgi:O-antigen/teichoic acid export membrane protein